MEAVKLCPLLIAGDSELSQISARSIYEHLRCCVELVPLVFDADQDSDYNKPLKIGSEPACYKVVTNKQFAVFVS